MEAMRQGLAERPDCIVFGVGTAGCAVAAEVCRANPAASVYLLDAAPAPPAPRCPGGETIRLGTASTPDAYTEADVERYTAAALPRLDAALLNHCRQVAVVAALGGRTGRAVAPLVIERARLFGKAVHAFVWMPAAFEDAAARPRAQAALQRVMLESDAVYFQNTDYLLESHRHLCAQRFWGLVEGQLVGQLMRMW